MHYLACVPTPKGITVINNIGALVFYISIIVFVIWNTAKYTDDGIPKELRNIGC